MAVAARVQRDIPAVTPRLRVFVGGRLRASTRPRKAPRTAQACRRTFTIACVCLTVFVALGMARVALTVKATEAALFANSLVADIEAERIVVEQLESSRSALIAPTRIKNLAETTMRMGIADEIGYIEMAPAGTAEADENRQLASAAGVKDDRIARILTGIMHMTAGEAQVLLVGDAGLTSSR